MIGRRIPQVRARLGRHLTLALTLASLWLLATAAGASDVRVRDGYQGWIEIGSFKGARSSGLLGRLSNWVFEQQRDSSLYQDLGAVKLGLGRTVEPVDFDWENYFDRRIVQKHEVLPPGSVLTANDLSGYQEVKKAITRLRFSWDYLPEVVGPISVGMEIEGGFAVASANTLTPRPLVGGPRDKLEWGPAGKEAKQYLEKHPVNAQNDLLDYTQAYLGVAADALAGGIGKLVADTEQSTIYFEDYADPISLFLDTGVPVDEKLFSGDDPTFAPGDTLTFTTFVGLSPIRAGFREYGVRINWRRFFRFLRETTIQERANDEALVRVRTSVTHGGERIPLRFRPEVRILFVTVGYTLFESRTDTFDELETDVTYRVDLGTEEGREAFRSLLRDSARTPFKPSIREELLRPGVEVLRWEYRDGKRQNTKTKASLFETYRYDKRDLSSNQEIQTDGFQMREVVRAKVTDLKKTFGRKRDYKISSIITSHGNVQLKIGRDGEDSEPPGTERVPDLAVSIATTIESRFASGTDVRQLAENVESILGLPERPQVLADLARKEGEEKTRFVMLLRMSFGWPQIIRMRTVDEDRIWTELAALMLGPKYRDAWSTEEKRFWWMPGERALGKVPDWDGHISAAYDRHRGYRRDYAKKGLGLTPDDWDARSLFIKASKIVRKFQKLQRLVGTGRGVSTLTQLYAKASDVVLVQALLVRLAGGVTDGGVGYEFEVFTDDMPEPVRLSNDIRHDFPYQRGGEIVGNVDQIEGSDSRLRAGRVLMNPTLGFNGEPCWKLRIYTDYHLDDEIELGVSVRQYRTGADYALRNFQLPMVRPTALVRTPFTPASYYYDFPLPWIEEVVSGGSYTLLLRLLNSELMPVSEEQEIRLDVPEAWESLVPDMCDEGFRNASRTASSSEP